MPTVPGADLFLRGQFVASLLWSEVYDALCRFLEERDIPVPRSYVTRHWAGGNVETWECWPRDILKLQKRVHKLQAIVGVIYLVQGFPTSWMTSRLAFTSQY
jgi:hypothetical protein